MSLEKPNGQLYIGAVKWASDFNNVILFSSKSARTEFLKSHLKLVSSNFDWTSPDAFVDVKTNIENCEKINYLMYIQDSSVSTTPYCCFVVDYQYRADNTTRLFIKLDVFQQYYYDTAFYLSLIDRAIIPKSKDVIGDYLLAEPMGASTNYSSEVSPFDDLDWGLQWCVISKSKQATVNNVKTYRYGGAGGDNELSGVYVYYVDNATELKNLLEQFQSENLTQDFLRALSDQSLLTGKTIEELTALIYGMQAGTYQDHRNDLISISAIPKWAKSSSEAIEANGARIITKNADVSISKNQMANGYTPRNKKLLTSNYSALVIYNRNGFRHIIKPEYASSTITLMLSGCTQPEGYLKCFISGYKDVLNKQFVISYNGQTQFGYNGTTGNEWRNLTGGVTNVISSVSNIVGGAITGNVPAMASSAMNLGETVLNLADSIAPRGVVTGSSNGRLDLIKANVIPRLAKICPNLDECEAIDTFFDKFGYRLDELGNVKSYMNTRSNWNYVKTNDIHLSLNAPKKYADELRELFNSGLTIWHNYTNFGDYSKANN